MAKIESPNTGAQSEAPTSDDDVFLLDIALILAKNKHIVLGLPAAASMLAFAIAFLMPNWYTATAKILPPQQTHSTAAAILGQLGGIGGVTGGSVGLKNPADVYVGMLKSRSIADSLIKKFKLQELFETATLDDARRRLAEITAISSGRDGIISVEVDDKDPSRAADLANAYVEQLERISERLAVTEAAQRRLFFEKQLSNQKESLASAEVELKKTQEQTGLIKLDEQGKAIIEAVAQVRAQIAAKEVHIGAMRSFTTEHNPERIRAEAELTGLRQQLGKLERNSVVLESGTFVPTGKVPEVGLEYVRKLREVKYHEALFELLAKQYELARLDESKDASVIQVLDRAVPPERKSKPKRAQIVFLTTLGVSLLALLLAFVKEKYERALLDPARAQRLHLLKSHVLPRSRGKSA